MGLKYELTEAPAEDIKPFYKEQDGKFILDVEGAVPETKLRETETKLAEFRTNNVTLKQQIEAATNTSLKDKKPADIDVEQILQTHVSELKTNYETQVTTLADQKKQLEAHLERVVLSDSVKEAAIKYGVQDSALPDVLNRAREAFTVKDGEAVLKDKKLDKEGKQYTVSSWIQSLSESAPHLFAQSRGSGSQKPVKGMPAQGELSAVDKIAKGLRDRNK